jgi:hypothetical protein
VYVVKPDQTVEDRAVVSNRTLESMAIVESGLKPSEVVVTDGQLLLVPGAKIEVKTGLLPAPEPKADKKPEGAPKSSGARAEGSKP